MWFRYSNLMHTEKFNTRLPRLCNTKSYFYDIFVLFTIYLSSDSIILSRLRTDIEMSEAFAEKKRRVQTSLKLNLLQPRALWQWHRTHILNLNAGLTTEKVMIVFIWWEISVSLAVNLYQGFQRRRPIHLREFSMSAYRQYSQSLTNRSGHPVSRER